MTDAYDCILAAIATSVEDDPVASRLNSILLALDDLLEMSRNEHREQVAERGQEHWCVVVQSPALGLVR